MACENDECGDFLRRTRYGRNIRCPLHGTHVVEWHGKPLMKYHWDAAMRADRTTEKPWLLCETHAKRQARSRPGSLIKRKESV